MPSLGACLLRLTHSFYTSLWIISVAMKISPRGAEDRKRNNQVFRAAAGNDAARALNQASVAGRFGVAESLRQPLGA